MIPALARREWFKYTGLFIILNAVLMYYELYYLSLLPLVAAVAFFAFFSLDRILLFIVFFVPLSIPLREFFPWLEIDFFIPTEPLLAGILVFFIAKLLIEKNFDKRILLHPVSLAIYFNVFWLGVTTLTSTMPVVSIKYLLARLWFLASFYFLATQLFRNYPRIKTYLFLYAVPVVVVIGYTLIRQSRITLFDQEIANYMVSPFFSDHTSYGAALVMFFPFLIGMGVRANYSPLGRFLIWVLVVIYALAIIFSYTRAAWLSLFIAAGVWLVVRFRVKWYLIAGVAVLLAGTFILFGTEIMLRLERNKQDSSGDLEKHLQSVSNVRSDASNLERINRWNCAIRMFREKPLQGWGPGTYMFQYAPFQFSYEKTIISTNSGNRGNAHSEYLGPLAESGFPGMLSILIIVVVSLYTGLRVYYRARDPEMKTIALTLVLGLITYFVHGVLNNFLDTDKLSAPVWGFIAALVSLQVYHGEPDPAPELPKSASE